MLALLLPRRLTCATVLLPTLLSAPGTVASVRGVADSSSAVATHDCTSAISGCFATENFLFAHASRSCCALPFFLPKNMLCGKFIRSDSIITFVTRHCCLHPEIATSCIVGEHASYMQMYVPYFESPHGRKLSIVGDHASYMQISGSTRLASTVERPDGDVAQCRISQIRR